MEIVLEISLGTLNNVDIQFDTESFTRSNYSIAKALTTSRQVELIDKYKLAQAALDENPEMFVIHDIVLEALEPAVYPSRAPLFAGL